jgi:hypothetical protein
MSKSPVAQAIRKAGEKYMLHISAVRLKKGSHPETLYAYSEAYNAALVAICELNNEHPGCVRWDCAERIRTADPASDEAYEICENPEHALPWDSQNLNDYQREFIDARIMREAVEVAAAALNKEVLARI